MRKAFSFRVVVAAVGLMLFARAATAADQSALRFDQYVLKDEQGGTGEVATMLIPAGWKTEGGMQWDLGDASPAQMLLRIYDPNSVASFGIYPSYAFYWKPNDRVFSQGQKYMGAMVWPPGKDQFDVLERIIIPHIRPDLAKARVTNREKTPKVSEAIYKNLPPGPHARSLIQSGWDRFEYQVNGQDVEEDFFVAYRQDMNVVYGYENWQVSQLMSVRAPKGKLDEYKKLHEVMVRSTKPNLAWFNRYTQFILARDRKMIAQIHAIGEMSRIMAQQSDQVREETKREYEAHQASEDAISEGRAETMRGETPWDSGDGNKVLLPADYGRAWKADNGEYMVSNDALYDPNSDPNLKSANWTAMQQLQH